MIIDKDDWSDYLMCNVTASHAQHPGYDSRRLHNRQDWCLSPVLGNKGFEMELVIQITINWLIMKWLVAALEPGLGDHTGPDHMELWHCAKKKLGTRPRILLTTL